MQLHDDDLALFSDLYKDAYGFRPNNTWVRSMTRAELEREFSAALDSLRSVAEEKAAAQQLAVIRLEDKLQELIHLGAGTREAALRWLAESVGEDLDDVGALEYTLGVPFGYLSDCAP